MIGGRCWKTGLSLAIFWVHILHGVYSSFSQRLITKDVNVLFDLKEICFRQSRFNTRPYPSMEHGNPSTVTARSTSSLSERFRGAEAAGVPSPALHRDLPYSYNVFASMLDLSLKLPSVTLKSKEQTLWRTITNNKEQSFVTVTHDNCQGIGFIMVLFNFTSNYVIKNEVLLWVVELILC